MIVTVTKPATNASASYVWEKLAAYSDFSWHPFFASSKNIGTIKDGSKDMVGAVRLLTNIEGKELKETVTAWSEEKRSQSFMIEGGLPAPVDSFLLTFTVREDDTDNKTTYVDAIADVQIKPLFCLLSPLLQFVLAKKVGSIVDGIVELKEK